MLLITPLVCWNATAVTISLWLSTEQIDTSEDAFKSLKPGMSLHEISERLGGDPGNYSNGKAAVYVQVFRGMSDADILLKRRKSVTMKAWVGSLRGIEVYFDEDGKAIRISHVFVLLKDDWIKIAMQKHSQKNQNRETQPGPRRENPGG